jgi:FHS family L-fucose permease-like MFS transporter
MQIAETRVTASEPTTDYKAMATVTSLFFAWGFITCLNDILIPHLKSIFQLNYFQSMLVQFAFFTGYFLFAQPAGKIIDKIGYKNTMVVGLLLMAVACLGFIPAATLTTYGIFLAALMVLAGGMTLLQVSANPYVTALGPVRTASSRLNLTQAFNSLGTTIAPVLGALFILGTTELADKDVKALSAAKYLLYQQTQAATVKMPYCVLAGLLVLLAIAIRFSKLPMLQNTSEIRIPVGQKVSKWELLKHGHLFLGIIGIFLYVGAEVSIGSFLVNYISQPYIGGISIAMAAKFVSYYWGGAMIGRFLGAAVMQRLPAARVLIFAATGAALLVLTSMLTFGWTAVIAILLVGFFNSVMFPTIFALGVEGLGPLTSAGSSMLIMAIIGGAIIPALQGTIADAIGIHHAFILPVLCYLYIIYFGWKSSGSRTASLAVAH